MTTRKEWFLVTTNHKQYFITKFVLDAYDNETNFRKLLQERIEKANPRCKLTTEEAKRLAKLETIADKLRRGENVQNRQLQTWLSEDEYAQLETE